MFIDSRLEFSDKQVVTGTNVVSTHTIDAQARNIGPGSPLFVVVQLNANASAAVTVTVQTADNDAFTGAVQLGSVAVAAGAKAGTRFVLGFPYTNKRYIRLQYSAAGTFSAWLAGEPPTAWQPYPAVV